MKRTLIFMLKFLRYRGLTLALAHNRGTFMLIGHTADGLSARTQALAHLRLLCRYSEI